MKKFKKVVSLLMMSAMLILPTVMPVQAEEVQNIDEKETVVTKAKKFGNASIKGDGIRLRKGPSTSATILGLLYEGDRIQTIHQAYSNGVWWYYIETESGLKGYILPKYIKYD